MGVQPLGLCSTYTNRCKPWHARRSGRHRFQAVLCVPFLNAHHTQGYPSVTSKPWFYVFHCSIIVCVFHTATRMLSPDVAAYEDEYQFSKSIGGPSSGSERGSGVRSERPAASGAKPSSTLETNIAKLNTFLPQNRQLTVRRDGSGVFDGFLNIYVTIPGRGVQARVCSRVRCLCGCTYKLWVLPKGMFCS